MARREFILLGGSTARPLVHVILAFAALIAIWKGSCAVLAAPPDTELNFARQVEIGPGRELFLECRGVAPTGYAVVLISGYHDSSDPWTQQPDTPLDQRSEVTRCVVSLESAYGRER
jgi:hypothetical protein